VEHRDLPLCVHFINLMQRFSKEKKILYFITKLKQTVLNAKPADILLDNFQRRRAFSEFGER
jgi:hypothetical protein